MQEEVIEQIKELQQEFSELYKNQQLVECINVLEDILNLKKQVFGQDSLEFKDTAENLSEILNITGMQYLKLNDFEQSIQLLKKAEKLYQFQVVQKYFPTTLNNLACFYRNTGKLKTSLQYLEEALKIETRDENINMINIADTHNNISAVLCSMKKHPEALENILLSIVYTQEQLISQCFKYINKPLQEAQKLKNTDFSQDLSNNNTLNNIKPNNQNNNNVNVNNSINNYKPQKNDNITNSYDNSVQQASENIYGGASNVILDKEIHNKFQQSTQERLGILIIGYYNLGVQLENNKRYQEANNIYTKAILLAQENLPQDHHIIATLNNAKQQLLQFQQNQRFQRKEKRMENQDVYDDFKIKSKINNWPLTSKRKIQNQKLDAIKASQTISKYSQKKIDFQKRSLTPLSHVENKTTKNFNTTYNSGFYNLPSQQRTKRIQSSHNGTIQNPRIKTDITKEQITPESSHDFDYKNHEQIFEQTNIETYNKNQTLQNDQDQIEDNQHIYTENPNIISRKSNYENNNNQQSVNNSIQNQAQTIKNSQNYQNNSQNSNYSNKNNNNIQHNVNNSISSKMNNSISNNIKNLNQISDLEINLNSKKINNNNNYE